MSGYIFDLRDNPGGLVKAGIDIARLLMDGTPTVFSIVGRDGEQQQRVALAGNSAAGSSGAAAAVPATMTTTAAAGAAAGMPRAATHAPLVVLVNERSASASEILSGALRDNGRALLLGESEHTFGKGRIQSVYELADGSGLFVTVAK